LLDREAPQEAGYLLGGGNCDDSGKLPQGRSLSQLFQDIRDLLLEEHREEDDPKHESGPGYGFHAVASQLLLEGTGGENLKYLTLPSDRKIHFSIITHDPEGHVLKYWISDTRGRGISVGPTVTEERPDPNDIWTGVEDHPKDFVVYSVPSLMAHCPSLAYNFELHVHGLATDGYQVTPRSQQVKKEVNLVVSEP